MAGNYEIQMLIEAVERKADLIMQLIEETPDIRGYADEVKLLTGLLQHYLQEDK